MNNILKNVIKKYLLTEDNNDLKLFLKEEDYQKYLKYNNLESDNSFVKIGELYSIEIRYLWEYDIYHYFDMDENLEDISFNPEKYLYPIDADVKYNFLEKWEYVEDLKRVVITHKNCNDGAGVAAVVKHHSDTILEENEIFDDIEYMYLDYNSFDFQELKTSLTGKLVYVGDFSFTLDQLNELKEVVQDIVVVDHHESVIKTGIANHSNVHIDLTKSGARLTWDFFFTGDFEPPLIIRLIEDRDLWNWFYGNAAKALTLMLKKEDVGIIDSYMSNDSEINSTKLRDDLTPYITEIEVIDKKNIERAKTARQYIINGITFHGLNLTSNVSDILNQVSNIFKTPSFAYWEDENGLFQLAFRNSDESDINVGDIARIYGGGGHPKASGTKLNFTDVMLEEFFINKHLYGIYNVKDDETNMFFAKYGIDVIDYVSGKTCETILTIMNKSFHDVFIVSKDNDNNLIIKIKEL